MAEERYINAYDFAEVIENLDITVAGKPARWNDAKYTVLKELAEAPTADVAPREDVEYWKEQCFHACMNNGCLDKAIVDAAVARKIFEEIEETLNRKIRRIEPEYERLDECFEKLSECGRSQHGYCKGVISTCEDLLDLLEELKKKYAEGRNER